MKKKTTIKLAVLVLAAGILLMGLVSGTFAKYLTEGTVTNEAKVAKWGVTIATTDASLFSSSYETDDTVFTEDDDSVVATSSSNLLVAPGTDGQLAGITISGTPEVAVRTSCVGTLTFSDNWKDKDGKYYCPIKFTIGSDSYYGLDYASLEAFKKAVEDAIKDSSNVKDFKAKTDLSAKTNVIPTIKWSWAYEGSNGAEVKRTDAKDTFLADQSTLPTIKLEVTVKATQIN